MRGRGRGTGIAEVCRGRGIGIGTNSVASAVPSAAGGVRYSLGTPRSLASDAADGNEEVAKAAASLDDAGPGAAAAPGTPAADGMAATAAMFAPGAGHTTVAPSIPSDGSRDWDIAGGPCSTGGGAATALSGGVSSCDVVVSVTVPLRDATNVKANQPTMRTTAAPEPTISTCDTREGLS